MNKFLLSIASASIVSLLAGCGGVSEVTKDRVARSETIVQQSQQTVANSEAGALELQRAQELMETAKSELRKENGEAAERFAAKAQLTAELAVAKTQSAQARKAADELMASIETLRQEAARMPASTTPTTTPAP